MGQATVKKLRSQPTKLYSFYVGATIESDARPIGVQFKKTAWPSTMIEFKTMDADYRITLKL